MKRKLVVLLVVLVVTLAVCIGAYFLFTGKEEAKEEVEIPAKEVLEENKNVLTSDEMPRVDASLATQPLMDAYVKYFGNDEILEQVKLNYTNTHPAYEKLIQGDADLIIVTEPSKEELQMAEGASVDLSITKVVNEGFVFFVNAKNPVDGLSLEQIVDIYSGKINYWNEVGGNSNKIIPYQRPINSGSQTGMLSLVMKGIEMREPTSEEAIESMGGIIDIVADYDNNIDGIGYSYYYYANVMYHTPNIKFLAIDGIEPTYETIGNETYPLMTAYYIVTRSDADEETLHFKDLLLSKEGMKVAQEAYYVPVQTS